MGPSGSPLVDSGGPGRLCWGLISGLPLPEQRLGVRLVEGINRCRGTVEVWRALSWAPVCGVSWNRVAAEAVCRVLGCGGLGALGQLGWPSSEQQLPSSGQAAGNASRTSNATREALAPAIQCSGDEWQLCKVVEEPCSGDQKPAQVSCAGTRVLDALSVRSHL